MKNFTYSLLPALFSFLFFSTNPNPTDINTQTKVDETANLQVEAEQEEEIKTFSLFNVTQNKGGKSEHLTGGVYLSLNEKDLSDLYNEKPKSLNFKLPTEEEEIELILHEQQIFTDDFVATVTNENGKQKFNYKKGLYYAGTVAGEPNSLVTISIFESKVMGILSMGKDNYNLGPVNQFSKNTDETYVFFKERDVITPPRIQCRVEDSSPDEPFGDMTGDVRYVAKQANVVKIFIDADFDMYQDNGNDEQNTMDFTTALFNEVAKLYANEQILTRIQEINVWTTSDPYPNSSSGAALDAFVAQVGDTFNGDLAHMISTASGNNGGLASLDVLCFKRRGHAYSNIRDNFLPVPTYSWSVEVFAHEMGHNLGSPHTQSCNWGPNNNQALDDCVATEGSCSRGPTPTDGGTIMSYCHLERNIGINFNNGFGIEPGNLIRQKVEEASCLEEIFDCFSKIELEPGVTYRGDSRDGGAAEFNNYACGPNIQHRGNEIAHVFKPEVSGMAFITYTENIPEQMNLLLVPNCLPDECVTFWEGAPLVRDSFMAIGGEEYTFITDVVEDSPGGEYTLRISFPNAACETGNVLQEGIIFSGDSRDLGTANTRNYGCNSTDYIGNEVGHSFTPDADGQAFLYYSENLPEQMDLILLSACDANQCTQSWTGGPNVRDSFDVIAGQTYFFFTDIKEDSEGGRYDILISFPGSGCATTVSLANGVTYSGNTSDGSANFVSYACGVSAQTGNEVGHYFVSANDGRARLQFNGPGLTLLQADACNPDNCYESYISGSIDQEIDINALESYYFIVDGQNAGSAPYDITITMAVQDLSCFCDDPSNDICENFDAYNPGDVSSQSECFAAGSSDGTVVVVPFDPSTASAANSGANSLNITTGQSTVLSLGNKSFGSHIMKFAYRPNDGKDGFFKVYHVYDPNNPANNEEAFDVRMEEVSGLTFGSLFQGNPVATSTAGNFGPLPIWKEFVFDIDLDNDLITMNYSGRTVAEWPFSNWRLGTEGQPILAAIEFYSDGNNTDFFIDDFGLYANNEVFCETSAGIYCEDFDTYADDQDLYVRNNPDEWLLNDTTGMSPLSGAAKASTGQSLSGAVAMEVRSGLAGAPFDDIVCFPFGQSISPSGGSLRQSMQVYVPLASTANLRTFHTFSLDGNPSNDIVASAIHFGIGGQGQVISGGNSFNFNYSFNNWLDYTQLIDFDNDIATIFIQGVAVATFPYSNTVGGTGTNSDYAGMGFNTIDQSGLQNQGVQFFVDNIEIIDQSLFLDIDPEDMFVDFPMGSDRVNVVTNLQTGWTAESQDSWLSLSNITSDGFDVEWEENVEITNRVGRVFVNGTGAARKTLNVTQIGADPIFSVDPPGPITADPSGETNMRFDVTANLRWSVHSNDAPWIVVPPDAGDEGNGFFTIDVERNLGPARNDTLFVEADPAAEAAIIIFQDEGPKYVGVASDTICLPALAGTMDFELEANTDWTLNNNSGWFTASPNTGNNTSDVTLDFQRNPTPDNRYYDLVISSSDAPDFTLVVKQEPEAPFLEADPLVIPVGVPSGMATFDITSNVNWTLSTTATWFTLSTLDGSGSETVTIDYEQNGDPFERTATIFVNGSNGVAEVAILVRQDGAGNLLSADPTEFNVGVPEGTVFTDVSSNITWTARTMDVWISINDMGIGPVNGSGDERLEISFEENNSTTSRSGTVFLRGPGVAEIQITINQDGGASTLRIDPETLTVDDQPGMFDFSVIANLPSWAIRSDVNWLQIDRDMGSGNATVRATYGENTNPGDRTAIITLSASGMPDQTLTVTQTGAGVVFEVDRDTITVDEAQQVSNFNVTTSNLSWTVSEIEPWIIIPGSSSSGFGNGSVTVQIFSNPGPTRYGNVNIEVAGIGTRTVVVEQTGTAPAPTLTVSDSEFRVPSSMGFEEFDVFSNGDWTATSNDSWITITDPAGGNGTMDASVDFDFDANPTTNERTGTITVEGGGLTRTVTVIQDGMSLDLTVSPEVILLVNPSSATRLVKVTTSANWLAVSNDSWIQIITPTGGMGSGNEDLDLNIEENTSIDDRIGTVTVTLEGTTISRTITVDQAGAAAVLTVSDDDLNVNALSGFEMVGIMSNKDWTATSSDSWISITPDAGSGDGTMRIDYTENTDLNGRNGTVTLSAQGCPDVTISVTQEGADAVLSVDNTIFSVNAPAGMETLEIMSNKNWTIVSNDAWINNLSTSNGSNDGTVNFNYDENTDVVSRMGTMTLSAAGCADITITVQQNAAGVIFTVSDTDFNVDPSSGNESVTITSNLDWTVKVSEPWLLVNPLMGSGTATIMIDYTQNMSLDTRIGMVTVCATGQPDQVITIRQAGVAPTLSFNPDRIIADQAGGSETVTVTSNTEWSFKTTATWITFDPDSGFENGTVSVNYTENPDLTERTAIITVCSPDLPDQTIEVTQSGRAGNLSVTPSNIPGVDAAGATETFVITADVDWTVKSTVNWLSFSPESGSGNETITVTVNTNIDANSRTGTISVCSPGLNDRTVEITQNGAVARQLSVDPNRFDLPASPGGTERITVTSNIDWQFTIDGGGWLTDITPANNMGSMNGVIEFSYPENIGAAPRGATITVSGVGVGDQVIEIVQRGVDFNLDLDRDNISLTADAGSNGFSIINTNVDWQITDDAANDWITSYNTVDGNGNSNITFDYEENTGLTTRTAIITVQGVGVPARTIEVNQAGRNAILSTDPIEFNVDASATNETFDITSNAGWMISASAGWVTNFTTLVGSGDETIGFSIDENTTGASRSAIITITGGGLTADIRVNQAAPDFFMDVDPEVINLPASAGNDAFRVISNVAWNVDVPASASSWLTPAVTSGNNTSDVNFTFTENTGSAVRSAIVTITGNGVANKTVEVNQQGTVPINLSVTPTDVSKTSVPGSQVFEVTSNVDWEVCTDATWIRLTPETGSDNGVFVASFGSNPSSDARVGTITVKSPGLPDQVVTITQDGFTPRLDADPKDFLVGSFQGIAEINVMSNVPWTIDPQGATWVEPFNGSFFGMDNATVQVRYQTNFNSAPRTAVLRLTTPVQGVAPVFIEITQSETNSIQELQELYDLNLFPNPVADDLNIDFQLLRGEDLTIDILDVSGKVIDVISNDFYGVNRHRISHNVSDLAQGVYMLRFKSEVGVLTKRFIVN